MNSQTGVNATLRSKVNQAPESSRYLPAEKPRSVLHKASSQATLASEVSFKPAATLASGGSNLYVRPVKNTQNRAVSTSALGQNGQISIRGERVIQLGSSLHEQIRTKVNSPTTPQVQSLTETKRAPQTQPAIKKPEVVQLTPEQAKYRSEELRKQIEQINQELFSQLKQKIASEITKQKNLPAEPAKAPGGIKKVPLPQVQLQTPPQPVAPVVQPMIQPVLAPVRPAPLPQVSPAALPQAQTPKPVEVRPEVASVPKTVIPEPVVVQKVKEAPKEPPKEEFASHITKLEQEIETLTKEVSHLDQTFLQLEKERNQKSLTALSEQLDYDQKVMEAVQTWRGSLTDLVNSHTIALKYLKQKTDWLGDKVEGLEGHRARHEKLHHKPKELEIKFEAAPKPAEIAKPAEPKLPISQPLPTATTAPTQTQPQVSSTAATSSAGPTWNTSVTNPAPVVEKTEVIKEKTLPPNPEQLKQAANEALKAQPQSLDQEAVKKIVEAEVAKEKARLEVDKKTSEIDSGMIEKLVSEALAKQGSASASVNLTSSNQGIEKGVTKEVPANIVVGQPKVLPGNPEAALNITAIPVSTTAKPKENLPTVATAATVSGQNDIERQILETAAREEAVKESVIKAKEEAAKKAKEQAEAAEQKVEQKEPAEADVTDESLKTKMTQLKSSLTTVGNKELDQLSGEERSAMMQKLQNLEQQTSISRQYNEIEATASRRKVNLELQSMLSRLGEKPPATAAPTSPPAQPQPIATGVVNPQVEVLKQQEKVQKTPEEKARIIAEIKALEREREAKKLEERSRPVVKAQPAYGKMLPNTPKIPNVINGIVKDNRGLLLDTVVIIVKDNDGNPVRAFKTNKIGQFALSTPVPDGVYTLELEKDGYDFDIIEIDVTGAIMPPVEIKAR
ncbi:MAG TPA: hypothetical protein VLE47_04205 [Candidatus Saccharimonadales bacterium]|nr:hypothetical protein [Candidatus Saccharimonadales bacterium]